MDASVVVDSKGNVESRQNINTPQEALAYIVDRKIHLQDGSNLRVDLVSNKLEEVINILEKKMSKNVQNVTQTEAEVINAEFKLLKTAVMLYRSAHTTNIKNHLSGRGTKKLSCNTSVLNIMGFMTSLRNILEARKDGDKIKLSLLIQKFVKDHRPKTRTGWNVTTRMRKTFNKEKTPEDHALIMTEAANTLQTAYKEAEVANAHQKEHGNRIGKMDAAEVNDKLTNPWNKNPAVEVTGQIVVFTLDNILDEIRKLNNPTDKAGMTTRSLVLEKMRSSLTEHYRISLNSGVDKIALFHNAKIGFINEVMSHLQKVQLNDEELSAFLTQVRVLCKIHDISTEQAQIQVLPNFIAHCEAQFKVKKTTLLGIRCQHPMITAVKNMVEIGCSTYADLQPVALEDCDSSWTIVHPEDPNMKAVAVGPIDFIGAKAVGELVKIVREADSNSTSISCPGPDPTAELKEERDEETCRTIGPEASTQPNSSGGITQSVPRRDGLDQPRVAGAPDQGSQLVVPAIPACGKLPHQISEESAAGESPTPMRSQQSRPIRESQRKRVRDLVPAT